MNYLMSRFGGHGIIIGKASDAHNPEDLAKHQL